MEVKFFLTGPPGSGKSTVFLRCVKSLKAMNFRVGGIASPEIRNKGRRIGFSVVDLATGHEGLLAGVDVSSPYRVGRYRIDLASFEAVALPALNHAEESCEVICIDEIGRMELFSASFKRRVDELIQGIKPMIAVLHHNYVKAYGGFGTLLHVSHDNRDSLPGFLVSCLERHLEHEDSIA